MRIQSIIVATAVIASSTLASCATAPREERVDASAMALLETLQPTGETETCISTTRISQIRPVTETKFLVEVGVRNYYLNETRGRCAGATRAFTYLQYATSLASLCRNEIITVVDNSGVTTGACGLGSFQKLEPKATE